MSERAPSARPIAHPEDFEQPAPKDAVCVYGGHAMNAVEGYIFFRNHWYCLAHFMRNGPLQH